MNDAKRIALAIVLVGCSSPIPSNGDAGVDAGTETGPMSTDAGNDAAAPDADAAALDGGLAPAPQGAYLVTFGEPLSGAPQTAALAVNGLDGVYVSKKWSEVEMSEGTYTFETLNSDLDTAAAAGKKISVGIGAGSVAPSWFCAKAGACLSFVIIPEYDKTQCNGVELPIPYSTTFLTAWLSLIDQLAADLGASPTRYAAVDVVKITGINGETEETDLPSQPAETHACTGGSACSGGTCTKPDDTSLWLANGYSLSAVKTAWTTIADHFHQMLPDKRLDYQVGTAWPDDSNPSLHTVLVGYGEATFPGFVVQSNGLNATGGGASEVAAAASSGFVTGYQTAFYVYGDSQCQMAGSMSVPAGTCPEHPERRGRCGDLEAGQVHRVLRGRRERLSEHHPLRPSEPLRPAILSSRVVLRRARSQT
jgi:hypothetical protein